MLRRTLTCTKSHEWRKKHLRYTQHNDSQGPSRLVVCETCGVVVPHFEDHETFQETLRRAGVDAELVHAADNAELTGFTVEHLCNAAGTSMKGGECVDMMPPRLATRLS
eukprot:2352176-Amphidinium_carterae.1